MLRDIAGARVRVSVRTGSEPGPAHEHRPLLLLNGIGAALELWDPLRDHLAHRTTIAIDAPGTGGSPLPWFPLSIAGFARVVAALLDELAAEAGTDDSTFDGTFDVVGYSFGGAVAQELAMFRGKRVASLALVATSVGIGSVPGDPAALTALVGPIPVRLLPPGGGSLLTLSGDQGTRANFRRADTAWAAHPPNPLGVWWQGLAIASWTSLPWLGRISTPTLVLAGADDRVVPPANARMLAARIPGAALRVVPGAGHFALLADAPGPMADTLEEFLRAPGDRQPGDQAPAAAT